jgi:2-oxoglutarate/2-oxoacid ferredoxin oxidoreductase subunit alpha
MLNDVRLAAEGNCTIAFYGRTGGAIPLPDEVMDALGELTGVRRRAAVGEGVCYG